MTRPINNKINVCSLILFLLIGINASAQNMDSLQLNSYINKAQFYLEHKEYEKARDNAVKALEIDSLSGRAYLLIGYAYTEFSKSPEVKYFPKCMIYCLVVDKFQKAMEVDPNVKERAEMLIKLYTRYFLSKENNFSEIREGDKYKVGYWINEETIVRFSD